MENRSETYFEKLSFIGASVHDMLSEKNGSAKGFEKIATYIKTKEQAQKLLDIGCGTGRLLKELQKQLPEKAFFGIDISRSMIHKARKRLNQSVTLSVQSIEQTQFSDNEFDLIIGTSGLYCWNRPVKGLNEIYRILQPGKTAYLYETIQEYDPEIVNINLQNNLVDAGLFRWFLSPLYLKKQLKQSYKKDEYIQLIEQSDFKSNYSIENEVLGSLPIYIRIELTKK
jgi:ubiquinone/menaquinone biosynthesis C-methylase UbiE